MLRKLFARSSSNIEPSVSKHSQTMSWLSRLFDWVANHVTPLSPRPVIVAYVRIAEQVLQHEPCEGGPFADAAVRNDFLVGSNALVLVESLDIIVGLESAIFLDGLGPWNVYRVWNVASALCVLCWVFGRC